VLGHAATHSFAKELNKVAGIVFDDEIGHRIGPCGMGPVGTFRSFSSARVLSRFSTSTPALKKAMGEKSILA
jgi:hypothetical protein